MRFGRGALLATLVVSGLMLAARGLFGTVLKVHSPMNVEGVVALAFLALLLTRDRKGQRAVGVPGSTALWAVLLMIMVAAGFARYLDFPLLADDYSHIWNARHADAKALAAHFTVAETDRFFRPVGYLSYAFDAQWAGLRATAWRGGNLAIHMVNTLLIFWLCVEMGLSRFGAFAGALIFGLHGSRPEAVTWVAARFDLLAVLFGVGCILAVLRGARVALSGALLIAALLSKESAYVVPFLAMGMLWYLRLPWRRTLPLFAIEAVAFCYRLYLLGGIGGYRNVANGSPTIFNFGFASSMKALLPRFWAVLLFPLNWTGELSLPLAMALLGALAALCYLAWRGAARRTAMLGVGLATICSLPVHQFLSIGPDLEKSRVLYFASVGIAILFGALFDTLSAPVLIAAACLVVFQGLALENNLAIWKRVGLLAEKTCIAAARVMPASVGGLPNVVDGVYFLHTGFPECVLFQNVGIAQGPGNRVYAWKESTRSLQMQGLEVK